MLRLPESLTIKRAPVAEQSLLQKSREWLEREKRDPRIHVSDLLDPRQGYWRRLDPKPLSDKLVTMFLIGKVLHAFVISAVEGVSADTLASDEGSRYNEELDLVYSVDKVVKGIPRELKTTRTYYEPKTVQDLAMYCEQLLCYMVAENVPKGQLWLLLLNAKDPETGRTAPVYRCYTVTVTEKDLALYKQAMAQTKTALTAALGANMHTALPLCRGFKCGETECEWWEKCRPEGRYGQKRPSKGWPDDDSVFIQIKPARPHEASTNKRRSRTAPAQRHYARAAAAPVRHRRRAK